MLEERPFEELPCGCCRYPSWTDGYLSNNFGDGPEVWVRGTHYEGWVDTSGCSEGHGIEWEESEAWEENFTTPGNVGEGNEGEEFDPDEYLSNVVWDFELPE